MKRNLKQLPILLMDNHTIKYQLTLYTELECKSIKMTRKENDGVLFFSIKVVSGPTYTHIHKFHG